MTTEIASIWLAHILTQSDHRKQPVRAWVRQDKETIERISGQQVRELDFTDDRLALLLCRVSNSVTWEAIEKELGRNILPVYALTPGRVRLDPTTISGYHAGGEESLFQYGYSKDDPSLRQVKLMVAALDPLGLPLSLDPLFVKRDDQVTGLTNLLSFAVRMLTLIEFVVRRSLKRNCEKLTGLIENNPKKVVNNPTTERLLKELDGIALTIVRMPDQIIRHVTPLTELQTRILELFGLSATIYTRLAKN
jgi:transposase